MKHDKLVKPCKLTPEQQKQLVQSYLQGTKTRQLAEEYKIDQLTVQRYLHRHNVQLRPNSGEYRIYTPEEAPMKHRSKMSEWRDRNPDKVTAYREAAKADGRYHATLRRRWLKRYGLTEDCLANLLKEQENNCAICGTPLDFSRTPHIDHCHTTGKVRGIVHNKCNVLIGYADESIEVLQGAIEYLKRHQDLYNGVAPIKCFLVEETGIGEVSLRRFTFTKDKECPGRNNWGHDAYVAIGQEEMRYREDGTIISPKELDHSDSRWPVKCDHCDYVFQAEDEWQTNIREFYESKDPEIPWHGTQWQMPPGAMYYPSWLQPKHSYSDSVNPSNHPKRWQTGPDGRCLMVKTPGGDWIIDSRASNCDMPEDNAHRCWVRHGEPPNITVDKNGLTCGAGGGSIQCGDYHGYLRDGWLVDA